MLKSITPLHYLWNFASIKGHKFRDATDTKRYPKVNIQTSNPLMKIK